MKIETITIILLILSSVFLTIFSGGNLNYLFYGILYSVIVFLVFFFARKKYKTLNKEQTVKFGLIALSIIVLITVLLGILFVLGMHYKILVDRCIRLCRS